MTAALKILTLFLIVFSSLVVEAREFMYLARSTKGLLLGDAYTTRADDEFALFYNPALVGRNNSVKITLLNPQAGMTNTINDLDKFTNFPSDPGAIVDRLMGFPIYVNLGAFPYIKMGPFAFSLVKNYNFNTVMLNSTHPTFRWDYRMDSGFIIAAAWGIGKSMGGDSWGPRVVRKKKKDSGGGDRLSFGFAIKHIDRGGVSDDYDVFGTRFFGAINSGASTLGEFRNVLGYSQGKGWGLDMGLDYVYKSSLGTFAAGVSALDIGNTRFTKYQGDYNVPMQKMSINSGISFSQDFGFMDYTLSFDVHPWNEAYSFSRKTHLGLELSIPFLKLYGGYNSGYLSYGTEFDLYIFSFLVGIHGIEVGAAYKQKEASRLVIYTSLLDFSFDP